jgi:hypothetical protein
MKYKSKTLKLNKQIIKVRLSPWHKEATNYVWLFSFGCGQSNRQLNDWLNKRKNKRAKHLNTNITGNVGLKAHSFAIKHLRNWTNELSPGNVIIFMCESKETSKQFNIYKKWFTRHEDIDWQIIEEKNCFFYNKTSLQLKY